MDETGRGRPAETGAGGKGLVEALANGGGGGDTSGLGVGFALSPELAQKVRECRGVSSAPVVPESSLTFLKAAASAAPNGSSDPAVNGAAVVSSERAAGGDGHVSTASSRLRPAGTIDGTTTSSASAAANGANGGSGRINDGGNLGTLERAHQDRSEGGGVEEGSSTRHEEGQAASNEAVPQKEEEDEVEGVVAATAVADPPDSWEEFDETSVPPAAAVTVPHGGNSAPERASSDAGAGGTGASSSSLGQKSANDDGHQRGHAEKDGIEGEIRLESAPVLLVDLARVCGFRVKGAEEAEAVGGKVRAALHESFADRSEELFEMGSAVHADTSTLAEELRRLSEASSIRSSWAVVDYPAKFGSPNAGSDGGVDTSEAWGAVTAPSACRAVEVVRTALVGTNRHLVWKRDMLEQLEAVAVAEREAKEARTNQEREQELEAWRERRREQLERLIEVRPMFERRRAMAEEKLIAAGSGGGGGGATGEGGDGAAADPVSAAVVKSLDAKLESIDDLIARLEIEEGEEGYGFVPSDGEDSDVDGYLYEDDDEGDDGQEYGGPNHHREGVVAREPQAAGEEEAAPVVEGGAAADAAARERAKKKNKKKKKFGRAGVVEQLKAKGFTDGAAHAARGQGGGGGGEGGEGADASPPEMGLLDAVAAMILGRYPKDPRATSEQHFEKIATMHQQMKDAWLAEFGRLPPMAGS